MVVHQFCKLEVVGSSPTQGSLWVLVQVTRHRKPIGNRPNDATPINTITYKKLYYGCGYPIPHTLFFRGVAERFIALVLKTGVAQVY